MRSADRVLTTCRLHLGMMEYILQSKIQSFNLNDNLFAVLQHCSCQAGLMCNDFLIDITGIQMNEAITLIE